MLDQPATTAATAERAKRQLIASDDKTRNEGKRWRLSMVEIIGLATTRWAGDLTARPPVRAAQINDTIDRKKQIGRAQNRTSASVSAQPRRTNSPTLEDSFMSELLAYKAG